MMNDVVSPFFADLMLWLMYLVLAVTFLVTAYSVWHSIRNRRKGDDIVNGVHAGRIGWCVALTLLACLLLTFILSPAEPVVSNGVLFSDTLWLKVTDMFIHTSILMIILCFASAIISRFRS